MPSTDPVKLANSVTKSKAFFVKKRWGGRRVCPKCGHRNLNCIGNQHACRRCKYKFGDFTGTPLAKIRLSLNVIAHLLYEFSLGVPAYRMRFYVDVNLDTVERTFKVFREAIFNSATTDQVLSGKLELDEAMFGGHHPGKRGWGAENKTIVFGIYARNGKIMTFIVPDRKRITLLNLIDRHTKKGSLYYTDDHTAYAVLGTRGRHEIVSHSQDEYVRGDSHINGIEGFWSYAKAWMYHYRGVQKQYFYLYLKEIEFRFNHRNDNLFEIISQIMVKPEAR